MEIVLHIGAHKTASTYLQKTLAQNTRRLLRHKVEFHGPKSLRPRLAEALARTRPRSDAGIHACRRDCLAWLIDDAEERGVSRLILSEEQFLGSLRDMAMGDDFYEQAQEAMAPLTEACGGRKVTVLMAIRDYADFLASAYGQVLRGWRFMPFDLRMREAFLAQQRGWPELIEDISSLLSKESTIRLWRYEDFEILEAAVKEALAGPVASEMRNLDSWPFPGPSHHAVDWLHERARNGNPPDQATVHAALDAAPKDAGYAAFNPWAAEERLYLAARYRQDHIWMSARSDVSWITASESVAA